MEGCGGSVYDIWSFATDEKDPSCRKESLIASDVLGDVSGVGSHPRTQDDKVGRRKISTLLQRYVGIDRRADLGHARERFS